MAFKFDMKYVRNVRFPYFLNARLLSKNRRRKFLSTIEGITSPIPLTPRTHH